MGGLLLIWLIIELCALSAKSWPFLVAGLAIYALWHLVIVPPRAYQAECARGRLRQECARCEIDDIALATTLAMLEAVRDPSVIEGSAVER